MCTTRRQLDLALRRLLIWGLGELGRRGGILNSKDNNNNDSYYLLNANHLLHIINPT